MSAGEGPITDLCHWQHVSHRERALSCLMLMDTASTQQTRSDLGAAAQTFALLAVSDALTDTRNGRTLGETAELLRELLA